MTRSTPSTPPSAVEDPKILRAAGGDRRAQEEILRELLPRVRNLVRYLVRGDRDVDDIAQKALIAIVKNLGSFRGEGKLTSWADRITARETFTHLRRERAEVESRRALEVAPEETQSPDRYVVRRELAAWLDELPFDQRHALVLHHVLGMSVPEMARELSIPEQTAKSRLRLGLEKLRARFGEEEVVV